MAASSIVCSSSKWKEISLLMLLMGQGTEWSWQAWSGWEAVKWTGARRKWFKEMVKVHKLENTEENVIDKMRIMERLNEQTG